jgi:ATP-binding cassette subfamily F protein 3
MLIVQNISKSYGTETILEAVSFVINKGDRVGFVGPNGSGKTTLLRIILGEDLPDSGQIVMDSSTTVGYLPQGQEPFFDQTVYQAIQGGIPGLESARHQVNKLSELLAKSPPDRLDELMQEYGDALEHFEALGGYAVDHVLEEVLGGLGLAEVPGDQPVDQLSGGQQTRLGLARLLVSNPNLLILDEPTNHLDIEALVWLENFLLDYNGAVLLVSHDRVFLDRTVNRILELDDQTHQVKEFTGNYQDYIEIKQRELTSQWAEWKDQEGEISRRQSDIRQTMNQAHHTERATKDSSTRRYAKKVAKKAKSREKKLRKYLESEDRIEKPIQSWEMKLDFPETSRSGQRVLVADNLGHHFDENWLFRNVNLTLTYGERFALLGRNGSGKTTLLEIFAGNLNPVEGEFRLGANVQCGYIPQNIEFQDSEQTPLEILRHIAPLSETEARKFLHYFLFSGDDVFLPFNHLSYGERVRLQLAKMVLGGKNFLLLDEPINHLDIPSRERFEAALLEFPGTVLVVAHDRAFIDRVATRTWSLDGKFKKP